MVSHAVPACGLASFRRGAVHRSWPIALSLVYLLSYLITPNAIPARPFRPLCRLPGSAAADTSFQHELPRRQPTPARSGFVAVALDPRTVRPCVPKLDERSLLKTMPSALDLDSGSVNRRPMRARRRVFHRQSRTRIHTRLHRPPDAAATNLCIAGYACWICRGPSGDWQPDEVNTLATC